MNELYISIEIVEESDVKMSSTPPDDPGVDDKMQCKNHVKCDTITGSLNVDELQPYGELLTEIIWSNINESTLPSEFILVVPNLLSLTLNDSPLLENLSDTIVKLKKLEKLRINNTSLINLPQCLCEMTHLNEISVKKSKLSDIPMALSTRSSLESLSITQSALLKIPECVSNLVQLTNLDLSGNCIAELPTSFKNLCNLESLTLSGKHLF